MRALLQGGFVFGLVLTVAGASAWAAKTYPNDMDAFRRKYPIEAPINVNKRSASRVFEPSEYPLGRNGARDVAKPSVATVRGPQKPTSVTDNLAHLK